MSLVHPFVARLSKKDKGYLEEIASLVGRTKSGAFRNWIHQYLPILKTQEGVQLKIRGDIQPEAQRDIESAVNAAMSRERVERGGVVRDGTYRPRRRNTSYEVCEGDDYVLPQFDHLMQSVYYFDNSNYN